MSPLLLAAAGNGWTRGVQETRRPSLFVLGANVTVVGRWRSGRWAVLGAG